MNNHTHISPSENSVIWQVRLANMQNHIFKDLLWIFYSVKQIKVKIKAQLTPADGLLRKFKVHCNNQLIKSLAIFNLYQYGSTWLTRWSWFDQGDQMHLCLADTERLTFYFYYSNRIRHDRWCYHKKHDYSSLPNNNIILHINNLQIIDDNIVKKSHTMYTSDSMLFRIVHYSFSEIAS